MAFIVVAPSVSRVLPAAASMHGMMGDRCSHAVTPSAPDVPPPAIDRCGYCVLLNHQSLLAAHTVLYVLPAPPLVAVRTIDDAPRVEAPPRFDARPRGPPYLA